MSPTTAPERPSVQYRVALDALSLIQQRLLSRHDDRRRLWAADCSSMADSLAAARLLPDHREILTAAPALFAKACGFDRTMLSRLEGPRWTLGHALDASYTPAVPLHRPSVPSIRLTGDMPEAEAARRRTVLLVDTRSGEHGPVSLTAHWNPSVYIVAPVVVNGVAIALLHADRPANGAPLTSRDRDRARHFAQGLAVIIERRLLLERAESLRERLARRVAEVNRTLHELETTPPTIEEEPVLPANPEVPAQVTGERRFTERELGVLDLLASGATNAQIAQRLCLSESTVKSHIKRIFRKLGVSTRAEAIATRLGLSSEPSRAVS